MLETIAMWGGVAGVAVALFAIIILFLTRQNILNILSKDSILYDQNFEVKMKSINLAYEVVDEIAQNGDIIKSNPQFIEKAKRAYNELLCVLSDVRIADEFQTIALENKNPYNIARIAQFKLMCRKDMGLKTSQSQAVNRALAEKDAQAAQMTQSQFAQPQYVQQPVQMAQPVQQTVPVQPATPAQPTATVQPAAPIQQATPVQQRPAAQPMRPAQAVRPTAAARPAAPRPAVRPAPGRPTNNGEM